MMLTSVVCPPCTNGTKAAPPETIGTVEAPLTSGGACAAAGWEKARQIATHVARQSDRHDAAGHTLEILILNGIVTT